MQIFISWLLSFTIDSLNLLYFSRNNCNKHCDIFQEIKKKTDLLLSNKFYIGILILIFYFILNVFFAEIKNYYSFWFDFIIFLMIFRMNSQVSATRGIYCQVQSGNLEEARQQLSMLISENTNDDDPQTIFNSLIINIARTIVTGYSAPVFYYLIGGIPLTLTYLFFNLTHCSNSYFNKAISIINYIPIRLSYICYVFAIFVCLLFSGVGGPLILGWKYRKSLSGINGCYLEALFSSLLNIQLILYDSKRGENITIGESVGIIKESDIKTCLFMQILLPGIIMLILYFIYLMI